MWFPRKYDMSESILVFTHRTREFLTKLNGSTSWSLSPSRAMKCDYLVCSRNAKSPLAEQDFSHGSAFLVAKVSNVTQSINLPRDEARYMIEFQEFAEVEISNFWQGWRSPIIYKKTEELDIDFASLKWLPVPDRDHQFIKDYFLKENSFYESTETTSQRSRERRLSKKQKGLSIKEAKQELSVFYDVSEANIDIVIRG